MTDLILCLTCDTIMEEEEPGELGTECAECRQPLTPVYTEAAFEALRKSLTRPTPEERPAYYVVEQRIVNPIPGEGWEPVDCPVLRTEAEAGKLAQEYTASMGSYDFRVTPVFARPGPDVLGEVREAMEILFTAKHVDQEHNAWGEVKIAENILRRILTTTEGETE